MRNLSYDAIQKIEINATKKLIDYINSNADVENILNGINYSYPYFQDESNRLAFNVWLCTDYLDKEGHSFVEKFLETKPVLKPYEKDILLEKNKSFVSLFEILDFDGENMIVKDVLQNQEHILWEPHLCKVLNEGEFIFARIGRIIDSYSFIGEINYLPDSVYSMFIDNILVSFNKTRRSEIQLKIKDYIKKYALELYKIYNNCILEAIEFDEDINSYLYDELDEFEGYLKNKSTAIAIRKHISNLMEFFEYYLAKDDLTLYDLEQIDFNNFFREAIKDEFILSQDDLNSYISTLKMYVFFLNIKNSKYKEVYQELLKISENRFYFMEKLKASSIPFGIDRYLASYISVSLNETSISLLIDFDKFILYTVDNPLELTVKKNHIKRKHLIDLLAILDNDIDLGKKQPNQEDIPLLDLFYTLSISLGLMLIKDNHLILTKKGTNFIRLKDEEKFSLIFKCIWSTDFIKEAIHYDPQLIEILKKDLVELMIISRENTVYGLSTVFTAFDNKPDFFYKYSKYLLALGLLKYSLYPDYTFEVTNLGKTVFKYFKDLETNEYDGIIELENYRNKKL